VFPTADIIRSARFETDLSQWSDMYSTQDPHERHTAQETRLNEAAASIAKIVDEEAGIVGSDHVFLGGISQGCATAVYTLLQLDRPLAGLVGMCSWLPEQSGLESGRQALQTPILRCHAQDDDVVDIRYGRELRDELVRMGFRVKWHGYENGGHWLNEPEGVDMWLRS